MLFAACQEWEELVSPTASDGHAESNEDEQPLLCPPPATKPHGVQDVQAPPLACPAQCLQGQGPMGACSFPPSPLALACACALPTAAWAPPSMASKSAQLLVLGQDTTAAG